MSQQSCWTSFWPTGGGDEETVLRSLVTLALISSIFVTAMGDSPVITELLSPSWFGYRALSASDSGEVGKLSDQNIAACATESSLLYRDLTSLIPQNSAKLLFSDQAIGS
ncbi:hypothetical protein CB1_002798002 [Camelus ferus]|nr:hypothetical protein CB1_002798002 [Camelus ferus]